MTLDRAKKGHILRIVAIENPEVRAQVIRFGISEGEMVKCSEVIPAGPIIICKNRQEIAFGRNLAQSITVDLV
ncbi:MAG: ferrous iron transport protein A [Peptococcaceae bacterium]|nr:ferrous iron transport protein A [Peptococcaceae bacterium]